MAARIAGQAQVSGLALARRRRAIEAIEKFSQCRIRRIRRAWCLAGLPRPLPGIPAYSPPTWPDAVSSAQMHLDFDVDDLDATEARALAAGATKYDFQPNDHCRVYADPAGHPFCLSTFQALQEQA